MSGLAGGLRGRAPRSAEGMVSLCNNAVQLQLMKHGGDQL
jgi:hypothetical protein